MTTATAGHPEKDKEKVEKRRALGRGLESLLPRVVSTFSRSKDAGTAGAEGPASQAADDAALKGHSSTVTGNSSVAGGETSVSHTVVPHESAAELRSAGQPGAAVPTYSPEGAAAPTSAVPITSSSAVSHFSQHQAGMGRPTAFPAVSGSAAIAPDREDAVAVRDNNRRV